MDSRSKLPCRVPTECPSLGRSPPQRCRVIGSYTRSSETTAGAKHRLVDWPAHAADRTECIKNDEKAIKLVLVPKPLQLVLISCNARAISRSQVCSSHTCNCACQCSSHACNCTCQCLSQQCLSHMVFFYSFRGVVHVRAHVQLIYHYP